MKKLDSADWSDFGIKRQRVEFVGDVQEHSGEFEMPRVDQAAYVFAFTKAKGS